MVDANSTSHYTKSRRSIHLSGAIGAPQEAAFMYGELIPVGGGDPIPLLKKSLLIGRRESCDIVLRFSNVSAHHCQLTVNARLLARSRPAKPQRSQGQRGAGDGQADRSRAICCRSPSTSTRCITRRSTWARSGRRRRRCPSANFFSKSLLERAGLERKFTADKTPSDPDEPVRYDITNDEPGQIRFRHHPLSDDALGHVREE